MIAAARVGIILLTSSIAQAQIELSERKARLSEREIERCRTTAEDVTIRRDAFGVPHIAGPTDASVVFGYAYARAEDRFRTLELFYLRALGRLASLSGEKALGWDLLIHACEVTEHARAEYNRSEPAVRALCDAFADGINWYLHTHPDQEVLGLPRFEPWFPLAGQRAMWSLYGFEWNGIRLDDVLAVAERIDDHDDRPLALAQAVAQNVAQDAPTMHLGCNEWALGASRSESGHPLLLIDLHMPLASTYEASLHSEEGYRLHGMSGYGHGILPICGHNDALGWAFTNNFIDWVDLYAEQFDHPTDPDRYRHGERYFRTGILEFDVRVLGESQPRRYRFHTTRHGPILATRDGQPIAVQIGGMMEGGALRQLYHMGRARNLDGFQEALDQNALVNQNLLYADVQGNIYYVYNGLIPKRNEEFDWSQPVDGSDPRTDWLGIHSLAERPQALNPEAGFLQNCNSSPHVLTGDDQPARYPRYMVSPRDADSRRAREARRLLQSKPKFSFEDWCALPFDAHLPVEDLRDQLVAELKPDPATDAARELLQSWDCQTGIASIETTLFIESWDLVLGRKLSWVDALQTAMQSLTDRFGTWRVAWGDANRLQRPLGDGNDDERHSFPVSGTRTGGAFVFLSRRGPNTKRRYGYHGHAYLAAIEFDPAGVNARTLTPFGSSSDPQSPHFSDQSPLYSKGDLKPRIATPSGRAYHPGLD